MDFNFLIFMDFNFLIFMDFNFLFLTKFSPLYKMKDLMLKLWSYQKRKEKILSSNLNYSTAQISLILTNLLEIYMSTGWPLIFFFVIFLPFIIFFSWMPLYIILWIILKLPFIHLFTLRDSDALAAYITPTIHSQNSRDLSAQNVEV